MDLAGLSLLYGSWTEPALRAVAALALIAVLLWSLRTAWKDSQWAKRASTPEALEEAGYSRTNHKIGPEAAKTHIGKLDKFVEAKIDAAKAKRMRMLFLGIVVPALVFLTILGWYSWFLPDSCTADARLCTFSIADGLRIVVGNILIGVSADLRNVLALADVSIPILASADYFTVDKPLLIVAFVARYYALPFLIAASRIQYAICNIKRINSAIRAELERTAYPVPAATLSRSWKGDLDPEHQLAQAAE
jgi:hypothetical protein